MIEVVTNRLLNWYSLVLLVLLVGSFVSVTNLMLQEQKNTENRPERSIEILMGDVLEKAPKERNFSILILTVSSYSLYCKALNLSGKEELNLTSYFLHIGGAVCAMFCFACAAQVSKWIHSGNLKE